MNIINSSWCLRTATMGDRKERDLQQEVAEGAEVFAHGHHREGEWQAGAGGCWHTATGRQGKREFNHKERKEHIENAGVSVQRALALGTLGRGKARKGTIRHVGRNFSLFCVCLVFAHGHHLGRGVETARILPQPLASSLGNLFFFVAARVLADWHHGSRMGTLPGAFMGCAHHQA
ncbi:MAG: hypothetical protein JWR26_4037 [Pedosphaera sp.]|nr:hypothetical protein [Pedosphaera sp.]